MIFRDLPIGSHFHYNGTEYKKHSSRTAKLISNPSVWFYFSVTLKISNY